MLIGASRAIRGALMTTLLAVMTAISLLAATPTAGAVNVLTLSPLPHRMGAALQGSMCASPNTCNPVKYSFAMNVSIANLAKAIQAATANVVPSGAEALPDADDVTVFALSGGAIGVSKWMAWHADEADAPSPEVLSFVLIGNPTRKYGGANRRLSAMPATQYKVLDIARQYDPIADTPDRFSLLAQLNLTLGFLSPLHVDYSSVDINDPGNYRWTEGNTTYILVPTENLPLLAPLRALGLKALADRLNGPLKEIIERAYIRPWERTPPEESRTVAQARTTDRVQSRTEQTEVRSANRRAAEPEATPTAGDESRSAAKDAVDEPGTTVEAATSGDDDANLSTRIGDQDEPVAASRAEDRQLSSPAARRAEKSDRDGARSAAREKNRAAKRDARSGD